MYGLTYLLASEKYDDTFGQHPDKGMEKKTRSNYKSRSELLDNINKIPDSGVSKPSNQTDESCCAIS